MKKSLRIFFQRHLYKRAALTLAGPLVLLLAGLQSVQAQTTTFPRVESFKSGTANQFTLYGNATLTGTGATGADPQGDGYLRLTTADGFKAGTAIDESSFPAPQGFSISFDFFSYGGNGADGFSVYLINGATTAFRIGADGGSLGYAQRGATPGVSNGYIGIGIDEFGNYANPTEGRVGGTSFTADAVSIRGAGNGNTTTDYPFIAGSGTLPFSLDVATKRAQQGSADYRRAFIDFIPFTDAAGVNSYRATIRIQNGDNVTTALSNVVVPTPPPTLRIGFSGSTGGNTNVHEIRSLAVVKPTIANDDQFSTRYRQTVSYDVTSNDKAEGSSLDKTTVDLDPRTATIDRTLVVPGKGTFTVDATTGVVTFEPLSTFAGVVTIPYTIRDILNTLSNQANITVTVTGADLATSISGPTTANPGAKVTYTVSTSNIGLETALNVVPTLQLPAGLSGVTVSSGSYNAGSGLVTFGTTASLAANAAPISNSASFTAPTTGSVTGTAAFTKPPSVPDPNTTNDAASITTTISGIANVATACATPGKDGPGSSTTAPNTYFPGTASIGKTATTLTVGAGTGSTSPIVAGDLLLIMQMQGADINTNNNTAYGANDGSGAGNLAANYTAGIYEYAIAAAGTNVTYANGGTLKLVAGLANDYTNANFVASSTGNGASRYQIIRIPQYSSLTVAGTVTGAAWNGTTGGVLALDVAGVTNFGTNGTLSMSGKGFRGGGGVGYGGSNNAKSTDYRINSNTAQAHGAKGEGLVGTPRNVNDNGAVLDTNVEGYPAGSVGAGAPGNAGGGGTDQNPGNNNHNTGGGGGANGGAGGAGGGYSTTTSLGGIGGVAVSSASAGRLFLGGGGGAGSTSDATNPNLSSGANGGGIIILRTGSVNGTGSIVADGNAATSNAGGFGAGGGGAGGTVVINAQTAAGLSNLTVSAKGGNGGSSTYDVDNLSRGAGGGGGGGLVYANSALKNTSLVTKGAGGSTRAGGAAGAAGSPGNDGKSYQTSQTAAIPAGIAASTSCLPMLTAALSAIPNNVTRSGSGNAVNPVIYTLTVSNTGGAAQAVGATVTMDNSGPNGGASGLFTYQAGNTVVRITANGATNTLVFNQDYTLVTAKDGTPTFGGINLPAGATLTISYQAAIAAKAVDGVTYQSNAKLSYSDPTRTATTAQVSPNDNYADVAAGKVPGSNYAAASSDREDVTIVKALPVELTRFEVVAAGRDARLSWTTASEKNNAYFEVQRSLDGKQFETIGKRTGQGSTQARTDYAYLDAGAGRLLAGQPIYYRLRQVDYDGQEAFSPVRVVTFGQAASTAVALYPNPTAQHPTVTLDLTGLPTGDYQVQVLDLTGRLLQQQTLAGGQRHPLAVQPLPMGSYLVQVHGGAIHLNLKLVRD